MSPRTHVIVLKARDTDRRYASLERALFAGATIVLALIAATLLLSSLEQLRERRRSLAVLIAVGARRRTLSWSVLWQSAIPVGLGLVVALSAGVGLGAVLAPIAGVPVRVEWATVAAMAGLGGAVVLLVTAGSLPALWRSTGVDGLRNE